MTLGPELPVLDFSQIGPAVGSRFPDVCLPDQTGQLLDVHAHRAGRRALFVVQPCKVQLVELQDARQNLQPAGLAIFALSYDSVETLAHFAETRGITYPLLSDQGSRTIRALGLLNDTHAFYGIQTREDQHGVAYPGTFVLDEHGVVVDKRFEQSYRVRPTAHLFEEFALGASGEIPSSAVREAGDALTVTAWTDASTYRPYQQVRLHVEIALQPGIHLYAGPVPDGYTALRLSVEHMDGLTVGESRWPPAQPFTVEGLDERFLVYQGSVRTVIPLQFSKNLGPTVLALLVDFQTCTVSMCSPPTTLRARVPLNGLDLIRD